MPRYVQWDCCWQPSTARAAALALLLLPLGCGAADPRDLYCGRDDCYGLLGLGRGSTSAEVKKAFRKLALQYHPDKNKEAGAADAFRRISRANEVLSDEKLRHAYDYFLDHPEDRYANYYQYYHAAYSPQTPLWAVILGSLIFLSVLQYINQSWRYASMMRAIQYQPQFKKRVNEVLEAEVATYKGKLSRTERALLRDRVEARVLESDVQVSGGGFAKPSLQSLVLVSALRLPLDVPVALCAALEWHWRFSIKKEAYGDKEKAYVTRIALGLSAGRWESFEEVDRQEFVARELWIDENLKAFHAEQLEEQQKRLAQSGAYKRAKRWMRNH